MEKQTSELQSDGSKKRLIDRIRHFSKDWPGNTWHIFQKIRNKRNFTLRLNTVAAANRVSDISAALDSVSSGVEPQFIKLGEELQSIFFDANRLKEQITGKAALFGEDSDQVLMIKISVCVEKSLAELRNFRAEVVKDIDHINCIISHLGRLQKKCDAFEQTAMVIRIVGLNIGVESTRSAESSAMFSIVSEEIRKISEKITDTTRAILNDVKTEQAEQVTTLREIVEWMNHLGELAEGSEQAVRQAFGHLEKLLDISIKILEGAGTHAGEISQHVGEIVQGIQLHDNMSQRIEHITNAFGDVEKLCGRWGEEKAPGGTKAERFGKAHSILTIQEAQLERVISKVDLLHEKNLEAFEKIKSKVEDLSETLPSFGSSAARERAGRDALTADPISALKSALQQLQGIQNEGRQLVERINITTSDASKTASSLSNHTKLVRRISLNTHIMALNAIVKAAHLGESGRTHEVLAQEMRSLSKRTDAFAEDVEKIIEQINQSAKDLTGGRTKDEEKGLADDTKAESLDTGIEELTQTYASFREGSAVILQRAQTLKAAITRTSNNLNFLPVLAQELGDHLKAVSEVCRMFSPWANTSHDGPQDGKTALTEGYTMAEEREIHERSLGIEDDAIELFTEDQQGDDPQEIQKGLENSSESSPNESSDEDDLGDNVELF